MTDTEELVKRWNERIRMVRDIVCAGNGTEAERDELERWTGEAADTIEALTARVTAMHNHHQDLLNRAAALEAENKRLREALEEYVYESTHLAIPETVGGREYRKTLVPYSAVKRARAALNPEGTDAERT